MKSMQVDRCGCDDAGKVKHLQRLASHALPGQISQDALVLKEKVLTPPLIPQQIPQVPGRSTGSVDAQSRSSNLSRRSDYFCSLDHLNSGKARETLSNIAAAAAAAAARSELTGP